ncbi:MAG: radical SAM protein, partial [Synergistaceae bacterium]|nr:radical SAM protein [Synergistaceae bacterium]
MKDFFGRELSYARISVTDRCNYRCRYCMPEDGIKWIPHDRILSYEEIFFLIGILCDLGVEKIRFTGGEPLIRKGMIRFLEKVAASFPGLRIALTTNGSTLAQYAPSLARMGLECVNVSLDTLDAEKFSVMTRGASLEPVLDGIDALTSLVSQTETEVKIKIKINSVLIRGFNDDSMIEQLADFAFKKGILLRFIEFMPFHSSLWSAEMFTPFPEALARLPGCAGRWTKDQTGAESPAGPARYYVNTATGQRIGVISAVSGHFCG